MTEPMIVVDRVSKAFGDLKAVDEVSFTVSTGTVVGVLGPNGAGKTTIINCLATLLRPDSGRAQVAGCDVVRDPAGVRAQIVLTGQFAAVDEVLTGRENLVLFGRLFRLGCAAARARADELLAELGLVDAADQAVGGYSGGMRRQLDLAVSLLVERPVLFLDEPTTGLDPRSRLALWEVVRQLRSAGRTILLTTQYLEEAERLADRILVIDHGRLIAEGTVDELKDRVGGSVCEVRLSDDAARARAYAALSAGLAGVAMADGAVTLPARGTKDMAEVIRLLDAAGLEPQDLALRRPTLDDVFLALTGQPAAAPVGRP